MPFLSLRGFPKNASLDEQKPSTPPKENNRAFLTLSPRKSLSSLLGTLSVGKSNSESQRDGCSGASIGPTSSDGTDKQEVAFAEGNKLSSSRVSPAHGNLAQTSTPSPQRNFLDVLAKAIRAPTSLFYKNEVSQPDVKAADGKHEDSPTRSRGLKPKKSVRFDRNKPESLQIEHSSPIAIPTHNPPSLPPLALNQAQFEDVSNLMGTTGRPLDTPMLEKVFSFKDSPSSDRHPVSDFSPPITPSSAGLTFPTPPGMVKSSGPRSDTHHAKPAWQEQREDTQKLIDAGRRIAGLAPMSNMVVAPAPLAIDSFRTWRDTTQNDRVETDSGSSIGTESPASLQQTNLTSSDASCNTLENRPTHQDVRRHFRETLRLSEETDDLHASSQTTRSSSNSSNCSIPTEQCTAVISESTPLSDQATSTQAVLLPVSTSAGIDRPESDKLEAKKRWSPFDEEHFVDAAYAAIQVANQNFRALLCANGGIHQFWQATDLPRKSCPPTSFPPYTGREVDDVCRKVINQSPIRGNHSAERARIVHAFIRRLQKSSLVQHKPVKIESSQQESIWPRARAKAFSEENSSIADSETSTLQYSGVATPSTITDDEQEQQACHVLNPTAEPFSPSPQSTPTKGQSHRGEEVTPTVKAPGHGLTRERLRMSTGSPESVVASRLPIRKTYANGGSIATASRVSFDTAMDPTNEYE